MLRELGNHEHRYIACAESRVVAAPSTQDTLRRHPSARAIIPHPLQSENLPSSLSTKLSVASRGPRLTKKGRCQSQIGLG